MDARLLRTRSRLHAAIMTLAAETPIADISVTEICRTAAVTRDTFYRHADSPTALLAEALAAEIAETMRVLPSSESIGDGERALLTHVHTRAAVYRGALRPGLAAPVRAVLEIAIRDGLELWAELHPSILPDLIAADPIARDLAVSYAATGTIGAIEAWLRSGEDDIERAVKIILAASPEWWLR